MAVRHLLELSLDTVLTAMARAGCGRPHVVFAGGAHYISPEAKGEVEAEALDELDALGVIRGTELTEDFADTLHLLDRPDTEYYAFLRTGDVQYTALVAARGRAAVVAAHRDGRVWLAPAEDNDLTTTLAAQLPEFPPADFTPFSVRQEEFTRLEHADAYERSRDASTMAALLEPPHYGLGYLHVARHAGGKREEAESTLSYLDAEAGRIGIELSGPPGNRYLNLFPGDAGRLAGKVASVRARLY
ncbi:ESX secretion-associated protein EspG [Amycolatopsis cihanbeyliensis]|uniref:ESAT-6 protein secretion system EspG family protein n=1 Tax=Amycolatopsis cihanbeyliensis TaxID=1128664 RepID=A0A542DJM5_AMYCI|nr:ESX secretion-associated protein EspG [Amycolatopsis cihanbeyliensis]TQJ03297.1 ESAT-6 protein secretion system EspG family protein [Amycolatopsis cihanbeyliensis]